MRPVVSKPLHACAVPIHCGFTQQWWSAEVFDERNRLASCATVQLLNVPDHGAPVQETVSGPMR